MIFSLGALGQQLDTAMDGNSNPTFDQLAENAPGFGSGNVNIDPSFPDHHDSEHYHHHYRRHHHE